MAKDLGFPAAVAGFVLWRLDNRLAALIDKVSKLHEAILELAGKVKC